MFHRLSSMPLVISYSGVFHTDLHSRCSSIPSPPCSSFYYFVCVVQVHLPPSKAVIGSVLRLQSVFHVVFRNLSWCMLHSFSNPLRPEPFVFIPGVMATSLCFKGISPQMRNASSCWKTLKAPLQSQLHCPEAISLGLESITWLKAPSDQRMQR